MANIAFAFAPDPRPFAFQVTPGAVQQYSAIPRARMTYQVNNSVITAKIATNTSSIVTTCTLPANYAYAFEYATASVQVLTDVDDADHFGNVGQLNFAFGDGLGTRRAQMVAAGATNTTANAGSAKVWETVNAYTPPIYNQEGATPSIILAFNDENAVDLTDEALFSCVVSCLQYDISQVFAFPLNFPLPVSQR